MNRIMRWTDRLSRRLDIIEYCVLGGLLVSMTVLAVLQILMRNLSGAGLIWGDEFLRLQVLWLGLFGAVAAGRQNRQISIDVVTRILPERPRQLLGLAIDLFTAAVCGVVAWKSLIFVQLEKEFGTRVLGHAPAWIFQSILPIAFTLLTLQCLLCFARRLETVFGKRTEPC